MPFGSLAQISHPGENRTVTLKWDRNMRRVLLTGLAAAGFLIGATLVGASTRSNAPVDDATREYWNEAHRLTLDQSRLLDRIERSATLPEATRLKTMSGQIFLHTSAVDRFLKSNYPDPQMLCFPPSGLGEVAGTDGASLEQVQVYCSLYRSTRDLLTVRSQFARQARLLVTPVVAAQSLHHQATKKTTPINLYQPPTNAQTGITASSREVLILVESSRQRLAQMQPSFPEALRISIEPSVPTLPTQSADLRSR